MIRSTSILIALALTVSVTGWAQQNVTINPGDDVMAILATVVDENSTVTFGPGRYNVTPDPNNPTSDFFQPPTGSVIKGAGSGLDPANSTIIDLGYSFSNGFAVEQQAEVLIEGMTIMRATVHVIQIEESFDVTFRDVWAFKAFDSLFNTDTGEEYKFENCLFSYCGDELLKCNDTPAFVTFTNCDFSNSSGVLVECEGASEMIFRNCIFYSGSGSSTDAIVEDGGSVIIRNSVLYDAVDDGSMVAENDGGLNVVANISGIEFTLDQTNIGVDPMYVAPPTFGNGMADVDLRLMAGSPALTAGSDAFADDNITASGSETFAGSRGPAGASVDHWALF